MNQVGLAVKYYLLPIVHMKLEYASCTRMHRLSALYLNVHIREHQDIHLQEPYLLRLQNFLRQLHMFVHFHHCPPMLEASDIAAAVECDYPELKKIADIVTCKCDDGAIADLIKKLEERINKR